MIQITLVLFISFFSISSFAFNSAISSATANAGVATVQMEDAPFINPALVALAPGYNFNSFYFQEAQTLNPQQGFAVSLSDNQKETLIPSALAYVQTHTKNLDENIKDFRLSVGKVVTKRFVLGVGVDYQNDGIGTLSYNQTNLFAGAIVFASKKLDLGLTLNNLLGGADTVPDDFRQRRTATAGLNYNVNELVRFKADITTDSTFYLNKPILAAGVENYLDHWLIFRIGLGRDNEQDTNIYSAGIGFVGPTFSLHYAFQSTPGIADTVRHTVDLSIPLW